MTKNRIENTTAAVRGNPILGLMTAHPGGIEAQEARGQAQLVASEVLPVEGLNDPVFAQWGVVVGEKVSGDPIFAHVTLPADWSKQRTDHSMWSKLVDEGGRERAMIFYKAAFYDRSAHIRTSRRFRISGDYSDATYKAGLLAMVVLDGDVELYRTTSVKDPTKPTSSTEAYRAREEISKTQGIECQVWLDEHCPDHADPVKSWMAEVRK